jgi:hypothetical protein
MAPPGDPKRACLWRGTWGNSLMMLVHPTLTAAEMDKACGVLDDVLGVAG